MVKVNPEDEEAFNRWYNEEHMPRALERFPGVLSGRRYKVLKGKRNINFSRSMNLKATSRRMQLSTRTSSNN
jgi:hypothetical protein